MTPFTHGTPWTQHSGRFRHNLGEQKLTRSLFIFFVLRYKHFSHAIRLVKMAGDSFLLQAGKGGLGGTPWLTIETHPSAWRVRRPRGVGVLACWNCDLCNQQAPSHSKHAISPQTEACFSTTHGFNWRLLLPPPLLLLLLLLLLLCLQLRKREAGIARQTWLWNQWLADKWGWQRLLVVDISVVAVL